MVIVILFGFGILLSQFYIFPSGLPQPAHFLIATSFVYTLVTKKRVLTFKKSEWQVKVIYLFILYSLLVNLTFASINSDFEFILSSAYIAFGVAVFLQIKKIIVDISENSLSISRFAFIGLMVLFVLAVLGLGDYKFFPRYNAFFNDPNQMAFWTLCIAAVLLVSKELPRYFKALVFVAALFIILKSASRSGLVGFAFLFFGYLTGQFIENRDKFGVKTIAIGICSLIFSLTTAYYIFLINADVFEFLMSRMDIVNVSDQADIRGYTRILEFPEYLLFGAGQGNDERFNPEGTEIHSTPAGILFYYGLIGLSIFTIFLYSILKKLKIHEKIIFLAPLMYSFSTLGFRTPIFWFYLGIFYVLALNNTSLRRMQRR